MVLGLCESIFAQMPSPELHTISQPGGQIGSTFDFQLGNGKNLDESQELVISHPGIIAVPATDPPLPFSDQPVPRYGFFQIKIGANVPPGIYDVQSKGRFGLSNSRSFLVTKEPWIIHHGTPDRINIKEPIQPNVVYLDQCQSRQQRFYRIELPQVKSEGNVRYAIETMAASIDSRSRLVATIYDTRGKTIASSAATVNNDIKLLIPETVSGPLVLGIHDHVYQGGPEHAYTFRLVSVQPSELAPLKPLPNTEKVAPTKLAIVERWRQVSDAIKSLQNPAIATDPNLMNTGIESLAALRLLFGANLSPSVSTVRPPINTGEIIQHSEFEVPEQKALPVPFPSTIAGAWEAEEDKDAFEFNLPAATTVVAETFSQRLGESTDSVMSLYRVDNPGAPNESLVLVASSDDAFVIEAPDLKFASKDSIVAFHSPQAATYRIVVRDQQLDSRPQRGLFHRYALEIRTPKPEFSIAAFTSFPIKELEQSRMTSPTLIKGATQSISIYKTSYDGFASPVEISGAGLPQGVEGRPTVIATEQQIAPFVINASLEAPSSQSRFAVIGTAPIDGQPVIKAAVPLELVWGPIDSYKSPVSRIAAPLNISSNSADTSPITIEVGTLEPITAQRGQPFKVAVKVNRRDGGKQNVIVRPRRLPAKWNAPEITIAADAVEGTIEVQLPKEAALGEFAFSTMCETKISLRPNPQLLERHQARLTMLENLKKEATTPPVKPEGDQAASSTPPPPKVDIASLDAEIEKTKKLVQQAQESSKQQDFTCQIPGLLARVKVVE